VCQRRLRMTEERIKELAEECSKKLNDLSDGIQDDEIIVFDYFCIVAAEARKGGIEEMRDEAIKTTEIFALSVSSTESVSSIESGPEGWIWQTLFGRLRQKAERLKEQG
jgi:hypothetical protein